MNPKCITITPAGIIYNGKGLCSLIDHRIPPVSSDASASFGIPGLSTVDDMAVLARSAARFSSHAGLDSGDIEGQVRQVMDETPLVCSSDGKPLAVSRWILDEFRQLVSGDIHLARLEKLHLLLCGQKGPENTRVIDNGPGAISHTSLALAMMGSMVLIKEPDLATIRLLGRYISRIPFHRVFLRMAYADAEELIDEPSPAEVVYWQNPNPSMSTQDMEYLGRDVIPGGFLVMQTGSSNYSQISIDEKKWQRIFYAELDEPGGISGFVMPTDYTEFKSWFLIFQRKHF